MVLALAEEDYCYGIGPLALRVTAVDPPGDSGEWVRLRGWELWPEGEGDIRDVLVRVSAIRRAVRPHDWRPAYGPAS
jgi:hypothetical protein